MDSSYQENKRRRRLDPDPVKLPKFPFEIIIEILSWLPIVSLLRFKSVCKQWHTLITQDYKFIAKHMGRARPLRLVYEYKQLPKYAAIVFDKDYSFYDRFAGLFLERSLTSPVWRIRNPATHQVLYLPCDAHKGNYWQVECGFNSVTGECKLLCAYERNGSKIFGDETYEVLTVGKDRKWRPLKCSNSSLLKHGKWALTQLARVASKVDGVVHYMENITDGRDANLQVQSIDLLSECITTSTLPRGAFLDLNKVWAMSWNQYPAVADIVEGALNVLVLEDYREHKWSNEKIVVPLKFLEDDPLLKDQITLVCVQFDELKFRKGGKTLLYDMKRERIKDNKHVQVGKELVAFHQPSVLSLKGMITEKITIQKRRLDQL